MFLQVLLHSLEVRSLFQVKLPTCYILVLVWFHCHFNIIVISNLNKIRVHLYQMASVSSDYFALVVEQCVRLRHVVSLRIIPFHIQLLFWSFLDWLTVGFLSFVLEFTFTFIEGTGVSNFPFISNSDADVSGLADYWLLAFGFGVYLYV